MGVLMLDATTGHHGVALGKRGDDTVIGVALLAVIVDDAGGTALGIGAETGRVPGIEAVVADDIGNLGGDALFGQQAGGIHPDFKVVEAMAGCGMDETGAGVIGDVIAIEERDFELVAAAEPAQRVEA